MTKIRISGIYDLATARATAALNIDFIGLNLTHGEKNAISPIKVSDYTQWLSGVKIIAQVHHLNQGKAERFIELLNLPYAEILSENASAANPSIWHFANNLESTDKTLTSTTNVENAAGDYHFLKINDISDAEVDHLKEKGISNYDIEIAAFLEDGQLTFEKLEALITKIRS